MNNPLILRDDHGPITVLTLNRSERRNALSRALIAALSDTLDQIATEPGIRAIVLAAAGPVFCAGMDLKEATEPDDTTEAQQQAVDDTQAIAHLIDQVHKFPRPVVAALHGDAYGGGAGLALACDLVVMADSARLGYPEVRRGLVAAIVVHDLVRQVGDRRARQLLLTGEPVSAEIALAWTLVNRVVPADRCQSEAVALAHTLIEAAPFALATTKRLLDEASNRPESLRGASAVTAAVRDSDEAREGMRAFLEKRPPHWKISTEHVPRYDQRDEG
ncbi:MAG: enoyl-CoA hydratase/isomerase family protein, partial [Isosphaeraceae bacterium]